MKKVLKFVSSITLIFALCLTMFSFSTFAAGSASASFNKASVTVGDTVTLTINVSAPDMSAIQATGSYNDAVLTLISGAEGGAGNFQIVEALNAESSKSFTVTFKAAKAGTCNVSVSGWVASGIPPADTDISASASVTVNDVSLSSNANLSSLRLSAGSLSPKFSQNVTEYTVNVKNNVTECKVYGTTADKNATIAVEGSAALKVGSNTRVIIVTAPSGAQKKYTLTIIRSAVVEESSDTSSTTELPSALETVIDGSSYVVLQDISSVEIPVGFNVTKRLYNNEEVSVAVDEKGNYELFYLKQADGEEVAPYTYDEEKNAFKKVQMISQGSNSYIVAQIPDNYKLPGGYVSKSVKIQEMKISAYQSDNEALKDMYYIYCYFGGDYSMYRYDTVENVLQRSPEFKLIPTDKSTGASDIEFINRFNMLSANAKTIVVCLCVAFVGILALVILAIIKLVKRGQFEDFDLEEEKTDDFDSITFNDDYEIDSDDEEIEETEE